MLQPLAQQLLGITPNRYPDTNIMNQELDLLFLPSSTSLSPDQFSLFCNHAKECFSSLVIQKKTFRNPELRQGNRFDPATELCQNFLHEMRQFLNTNHLSHAIHLENFWRLLIEECQWRFFGFLNCDTFMRVPIKLNQKRKNESNEDEEQLIQYYQLELKLEDTAFSMSKQCHDNMRFFMFGYYHTFPLSMDDTWWCGSCLGDTMATVEHVVLIDIDNAGQSIRLLAQLEFKYPNCLFFFVAGPTYKPPLMLNQFLSTLPKNQLQYIQLFLSDKAEEFDKMNKLEQFLYTFYANGYFKKWKDAADYALGAFCGVFHRILNMTSQLWIVSKDDGLEHIIRHLKKRGRAARRITQEQMIPIWNEEILHLNYFEPLLQAKLEIPLAIEEAPIVSREKDVPEDELEMTSVTNYEINKAFASVLGVDFEREKWETITAKNICKWYTNNSQPTVRHFSLRGRRFGLSGFAPLFNIFTELSSTLDNIDMRGCRVGDDNIIAMCTILQKLGVNCHVRLIDWGANFITDKACNAIGQFLETNSSVKQLDLRWNQIGTIGSNLLSKALEKNDSLQFLCLRLNPIGRQGIHCILSSANHLCAIDLRDTSRKGEESIDIGNHLSIANCQLMQLDMNGCHIGNSGIHFLASYVRKNSYLIRLALDYNQLHDDGCKVLSEALSQNTTLVVLSLAHNYITSEGVYYLATMLQKNRTLIYLDLQKNLIDSKGVAALSMALTKNQVLTYLNLKGQQVGNMAVDALAKLLHQNQSLLQIDVSSNLISHSVTQFLSAVSSHPTLEIIDLSANSIGDKSFAEFSNTNDNLETLYLEWNGLRDESMMQLSASSHQLKRLFLSRNELGNQGINDLVSNHTIISSWLPNLQSVKVSPSMKHLVQLISTSQLMHLDVSKNNLTLDDLEYLLHGITNSKHLALLNLSDNMLGLEGAKMLQQMLSKNQSLVCLLVNNCQLGDDGLDFICQGLSNNKYLIALKCLNNQIGNFGAKSLAQLLLSKNCVLSHIFLDNNLIEDEGCQELAKAIELNESLAIINLERNKMTKVGLSALFEAATTQACRMNHYGGHLPLLLVNV